MQENNSNNSFTWKDLLWDCIAHWKWFVLSLTVCLTAAWYKIASSNEIYQSTASLLIKSEDKSSSMRQMRDAFDMMGISGMSNNVHNELFTLSSPTLMAEVLETMRLNETYHIKDGLRNKDLYKQEPVVVTFENPIKLPRTVQMDITIVSHSEFELANINAGGKESGKEITATAGKYVSTPAGRVLLSHTSHFTEDMIGKTVHYMRSDPMILADGYVAALNVQIPDREASVIDITYNDVSPMKATDLITTLIEVYNDQWVANQNARMKSLTEMVNARIDVTLKELNEAESNISSYMSRNLVSDFDQASSAYFRQNMELTKEIMEYRTQVNIAKSMLASLSGSEYITLPPSNLSDNTISSQIHEYNQLVLERNKLLENTTPSNTIVSNMTKSIQVIRDGIIRSLKGLINNTNMTVASLEKQMGDSQQQLASTPIEARKLANVKREQKIKEELYLFLLKKREENDMSQSFASDNSQVIVKPHATMMPIAPKKRAIIVASLIVGLALPVAILLLLALLDTTVHTKKDLESLKASFLGEIPLVKAHKRWKYLPSWLQDKPWKKKEDKHEVLVKQNSRNIINESFRILRTKIDFMNKAGQNKVFVVTSIQPGSGKSFISMNIAASYALKGSKVLVIDMDLRRATASKYVPGAKHAKGIADYLSENDSDYKDIIIKNPIVEGMDVIPVGTIPPNPAELILSERLSALLSELRKEYDCIFLDCPPIDIVAESGEIARYADMALFVVRAGLYQKALLPEIDDLYKKKVFNNMVILLNGVTDAGHYGYGKYGRYGYGKYGRYGRYGRYGYGKYGYGKSGYYTDK